MPEVIFTGAAGRIEVAPAFAVVDIDAVARYCDRIIVRWIAMEGVAHPSRQTIHSSNGGGGREHGVQGACL